MWADPRLYAGAAEALQAGQLQGIVEVNGQSKLQSCPWRERESDLLAQIQNSSPRKAQKAFQWHRQVPFCSCTGSFDTFCQHCQSVAAREKNSFVHTVVDGENILCQGSSFQSQHESLLSALFM